MTKTIKVLNLGKTRISIEPHELFFVSGSDDAVAVDLKNEIIISAYKSICEIIEPNPNNIEGGGKK